MKAEHGSFKFSTFGQATCDVTPNGNVAVTFFSVDEENEALLIQNWPGLLENP